MKFYRLGSSGDHTESPRWNPALVHGAQRQLGVGLGLCSESFSLHGGITASCLVPWLASCGPRGLGRAGDARRASSACRPTCFTPSPPGKGAHPLRCLLWDQRSQSNQSIRWITRSPTCGIAQHPHRSQVHICGSTAERSRSRRLRPGLMTAMATYRKNQTSTRPHERTSHAGLSLGLGQRVTVAGGSLPRSRGAPGGWAEAASCL